MRHRFVGFLWGLSPAQTVIFPFLTVSPAAAAAADRRSHNFIPITSVVVVVPPAPPSSNLLPFRFCTSLSLPCTPLRALFRSSCPSSFQSCTSPPKATRPFAR
ncbi:hypothetical protein DFJ73DRAFT_419653 [Zopfochytrium polystomum]|nr:hypothetical protein DFJ73DRAFT_419653 [Zopfochytrium polystomum]